MLRFILRRLGAAAFLIFGLLTLTFFIVRLAPGDPVTLYVQDDFDPDFAEHLKTSLGLNQPMHVQYVTWIKSMATGELGTSFSKRAPVLDVLLDTFPNTLLLTVCAYIVNLTLGLLIGILSAMYKGSRMERWSGNVWLFLYGLPEFWLGIMLILLFAQTLGVLPASGMHSPFAFSYSPLEYVWDVVQHLVLPVFVLGISSAAAVARYMRASILDVMDREYIRTARAKGLGEWRIMWKHAFRNALLPVITLVGLSFPFLLGGAVVVESVFGWPGMGKLTVDAIFTRDYPLIIGCTLVAGSMVIFGNIIADVLCAMADPRIKIQEKQ
jgi:peptide/nickel transport system permease protein